MQCYCERNGNGFEIYYRDTNNGTHWLHVNLSGEKNISNNSQFGHLGICVFHLLKWENKHRKTHVGGEKLEITILSLDSLSFRHLWDTQMGIFGRQQKMFSIAQEIPKCPMWWVSVTFMSK